MLILPASNCGLFVLNRSKVSCHVNARGGSAFWAKHEMANRRPKYTRRIGRCICPPYVLSWNLYADKQRRGSARAQRRHTACARTRDENDQSEENECERNQRRTSN